MTDREDRDGEQLELGLPNSSAPPATRADCPTERPCPKYGCKHHNHTDTDRAGRPYGGRAPEPKLLPQHVRDRVESCSLDVGDRGEHDTNYVAKQCNETPRRVLQVEARAQQKVAIALMLEEVIDEHLRSKLPPGAKLETVYPRNVDDSGHVHIHLVFSVGKVSPLVHVRKK